MLKFRNFSFIVSDRFILYLVLATFFILVCYFAAPLPMGLKRSIFPVTVFLGLVLFVLGTLLLVRARRIEGANKLKIWLTLAGISAAGIPAGAILHNLVSGLIAVLFGEAFGDEPVFFLLAMVVLPLVLLVSAGASLLLLSK